MQGTDYSVSDRQLTLSKAIPANSLLKIYRETTTDTIVSWNDASVLRAKDMSLQEVQLLHLAEETADKVFDTGMSTAPTNTNVWDGQYKRITNLLDPQEDGDAVTLRYVNDKQHGLLNALKNEGANQNASIVATGNTQNTRLNTTGDTQNKRLTDTGDAQNSRLISTGDSYVETMTSLKADATTQANTATTKANEAKNSATSASSSASTATTKANEASKSATSASGSASTATTKATEASNSAELAKKWAMSDSSPDGVSGNKSSKTWASEAKNSATSASSSASTATTKATEASNSASAAAKSAQDAAKFDTSSYYMKTEVDNKIADAILQTKEALYPVGAIFISLTDNRNPAEILGFGTWESLPAGYGLVAQGTATAEDGSTLTFTAGQKSGEFKHQLSVGELPRIEGNFGCSVPNNHHLFANGVFHTMYFGNRTEGVARAPSENGEIFGYYIEFGNNQYHSNVAPCISAFCWKRTA